MLKKAILLLSAALSLGSSVNAQQPVGWCATDQHYREYKERYPEKMAAIEKQIAQEMARLNLSQFKTTADTDTVVFHIPIVAHVVHAYGNSYITDEKVYDMIKDANKYFNAQNSQLSQVIAPFVKYIGNPRVEFHLASRDPLGRRTKGITHRYSYLTNGGDDQAKFDLWAPDRYLNIWIIDRIGRGDGGVAAYSRFPSMAASNPYDDGIITGYAYVGDNEGSTISHEIGHYFNLFHVWGNTPVATQCGDDEVDDTPPNKGHFAATGNCNLPSVLYDTTCINTGTKIGRIMLDTVNGKPIRTNSSNNAGVGFHAHTGITIDTVSIYPATRGSIFDISLLRKNGSVIKRLSDLPLVKLGRTAPVNNPVRDTFTSRKSASMSFTTQKPIRIESVDIYPDTIGAPFTIKLYEADSVLSTYSGVTTTKTGPQTVPLGFFVATSLFARAIPPRPASDFRLVLTENPGMLRDTVLNRIPAVDSQAAGIAYLRYAVDTTSGTDRKRAYNFFYNWQIRHHGVTFTDTSVQNVGLVGFLAPSDSFYRVEMNVNPGMKTDSVEVPLYSLGVPCVITMINDLTNKRYNTIYNWRIKYGYVKNCIDYPDTTNTQNIMDYSNCAIHFTKLQVVRMRAALRSDIGNRDNLAKWQNHVVTGIVDPVTGKYGVKYDLPMIPDFSVERTGVAANNGSHYLCANEVDFVFRNRSWGDTLETLTFKAVDGTPSELTSPQANATFRTKINKPGWATVSLYAKGNNIPVDSSITIERTPVYAADPNFVLDPMNSYQEFSDDVQNEKWPIFNYFNNEFKWKVVKNAGYYDNTSMMYSAYDARIFPASLVGAPGGDYDDFFTPAYDLSGMTTGNCNINFMYSSASRVNNEKLMLDRLRISYSVDCGNTWQDIKSMTGRELANKGSYPNPYAPLWMGDWALASMQIPQAARKARVFFRFRYEPSDNPAMNYLGSGNNFYLDRINISSFPLGVNTLINENKKIAVAPNPTTGNAFIILQNNGQTNAYVQVSDITGKVVYRVEAKLNSKVERIEIPAAAIAVKGIYLVNVVTGDQSYTEKLIAQ